MSQDLGRDVLDLEKLYARKLWADFSFPALGDDWPVPNPPGANPMVAERAPWRSSQSRVTGGQQPIAHLAIPVRPQ